MVAFIVAEIWAHHLALDTELKLVAIMTFVLWVEAQIFLALLTLDVHLSVLQLWAGGAPFSEEAVIFLLASWRYFKSNFRLTR